MAWRTKLGVGPADAALMLSASDSALGVAAAATTGASLSRRRAVAAAVFASWPPFAISSKKSFCNAATARALARAAASWSDFVVPVGGTLAHREPDAKSAPAAAAAGDALEASAPCTASAIATPAAPAELLGLPGAALLARARACWQSGA